MTILILLFVEWVKCGHGAWWVHVVAVSLEILNKNFQALMDLEESVGEGSRGFIDEFPNPVHKNIYIDYYVVVKDPVCIDQVEKRSVRSVRV